MTAPTKPVPLSEDEEREIRDTYKKGGRPKMVWPAQLLASLDAAREENARLREAIEEAADLITRLRNIVHSPDHHNPINILGNWAARHAAKPEEGEAKT